MKNKAAPFQVKKRLTQRAADWWDSAPFSSIFLASGFSCSRSRIHARQPAANASRWLAPCTISEKKEYDIHDHDTQAITN
jgi:hypothetical protein